MEAHPSGSGVGVEADALGLLACPSRVGGRFDAGRDPSPPPPTRGRPRWGYARPGGVGGGARIASRSGSTGRRRLLCVSTARSVKGSQSPMESLLARPPGMFRLFPNVKTTAAYFPLHQVIELSEIDRPTFERSLNPSQPREALRVIPLLLHEVRHWWDHIGTVWGQARLLSAFGAIRSRLGDDEREFWRILNYHRTVTV